jgi:glyoxylase-like metal-dependent hydrolase (beta-lactamase superfamily II)
MPADARNRITLSMNCLLISAGGKRILVETGRAKMLNPKLRDIYGLDGPFLTDRLRDHDLQPERNRHRDRYAPAFRSLRRQHAHGKDKVSLPSQRYSTSSKGRIRARQAPQRARSRQLFDRELRPLEAKGKADAARGRSRHRSRRRVIRVPGHTANMQCVKLSGGGKTAFVLADIVPTTAHLSLAVDYGLRSLPHDHAGKQKEVDSRGPPRGMARPFCARRKRPGGLSLRARRPLGSRTRRGGLRMAKAAKAFRAKPRQVQQDSRGKQRERQRSVSSAAAACIHMAGLTDTREVRVKTPFGDPSDAIVIGTLEGQRVAFLARHGRGHVFSHPAKSTTAPISAR